MNDICAIVLAGGQGTRFGCRKQFEQLWGKPLYQHVYYKLLQLLSEDKIVVVGVDVEGGETRSGSVMNGLRAIPPCSKVIIAEAARPLVTINQIETLLDIKADSATFVAPCIDTIVMKEGTYIDRNMCYRMQTPQLFNYSLLKAAYETGKYTDMTDETRVLFEEYGIKPTFVEGGENLYKVTYPKDIRFLEFFMDKYNTLP